MTFKADVMFDPLRDDLRFKETLKRLNLAHCVAVCCALNLIYA